MIKLKLFQSEWEALYNFPIQYFLLLKKNTDVVNRTRMQKAFFFELPKLEKKCFLAKNKGGAKQVNFEYFEAFAFLELLKQYPTNVNDVWLQTIIQMSINFLDNHL